MVQVVAEPTVLFLVLTFLLFRQVAEKVAVLTKDHFLVVLVVVVSETTKEVPLELAVKELRVPAVKEVAPVVEVVAVVVPAAVVLVRLVEQVWHQASQAVLSLEVAAVVVVLMLLLALLKALVVLVAAEMVVRVVRLLQAQVQPILVVAAVAAVAVVVVTTQMALAAARESLSYAIRFPILPRQHLLLEAAPRPQPTVCTLSTHLER